MAFVEQDSLHAIRPIRTLVHVPKWCVAWRCQKVLPSSDALCDRCPSVSPWAVPVLLKQYDFAKICVDDTRFSPDLHKDRRVTLNKKQKNEISDSTAYITETHQTMWSLLTNTIRMAERSCIWWLQRLKRVWWQLDISQRYSIPEWTDYS